MKLTGYDITLEPTGLHKITLDCIGNENDLETIRKVYNSEVCQGIIGLSRSREKENKATNKVMISAEQVAWDEGYDKGWNQRGKLDEIAYGRSALRIKKNNLQRSCNDCILG